MLKFYRPNFRAGVCIVKEPTVQGSDSEPYTGYTFRVSDQNQNFTFIDEAYILAHYPVLFTVVGG